MGRYLSPPLAALLASGSCKSHDAVDVTLGDGTALHLATGRVQVGATAYEPDIEEVDPLQLSLGQAVDKATFKVQNVDLVMGQAVTGASNPMDGAEAVLGMIFIDEETNAVYYDERMHGEIVGAQTTEKNVQFNVISDISAAQIGGRLISDVFPYRDVPPAVPTPVAPGEIGGGGGSGAVGGVGDGSGEVGGGGFGGTAPGFGGSGRYPIMDSIM